MANNMLIGCVSTRRATRDDIHAVAKLHREYIGWGFLSLLGERILTLIYRSLNEFPGGAVIVATEDGKVTGFVAGLLHLGQFYAYLLRKHFLPLCSLLFLRLRNPSTVKKIAEIFLYGVKTSPDLPEPELLSIVVEAGHQGKGIAGLLFEELGAWFKKRGVNRFKTTVGCRNERSSRFFEKMGCKQVGKVQIHKGEASRIYVYPSD